MVILTGAEYRWCWCRAAFSFNSPSGQQSLIVTSVMLIVKIPSRCNTVVTVVKVSNCSDTLQCRHCAPRLVTSGQTALRGEMQVWWRQPLIANLYFYCVPCNLSVHSVNLPRQSRREKYDIFTLYQRSSFGTTRPYHGLKCVWLTIYELELHEMKKSEAEVEDG